MLVFLVPAGDSRTENESAMGDSCVVAVKFLLSDEMDCCVVVREVIGHCFDVVLDLSEICALLGNYKALSCVLVACGKFGILTVSYCFKSTRNGDSVLLSVLYAFYSSDSV